MCASTSAKFFADILLCPWETVKLKVQTVPGYANGLTDGTSRLMREEGVAGMYQILPTLWGRQITYTIIKFVAFERVCEKFRAFSFRKFVWPMTHQQHRNHRPNLPFHGRKLGPSQTKPNNYDGHSSLVTQRVSFAESFRIPPIRWRLCSRRTLNQVSDLEREWARFILVPMESRESDSMDCGKGLDQESSWLEPWPGCSGLFTIPSRLQAKPRRLLFSYKSIVQLPMIEFMSKL